MAPTRKGVQKVFPLTFRRPLEALFWALLGEALPFGSLIIVLAFFSWCPPL
jgi:hypothetical protein